MPRFSAWLMVRSPAPPRVPPVAWNAGVVLSKVKAVSKLSVPAASLRVPAPLISENLLVPPLTITVALLAMSTTLAAAPLPLSSESDPAWTFRVPVLLKTRAEPKFWVAALVLSMVPVLLTAPGLPLELKLSGVAAVEAMVSVPVLSRRDCKPPKLSPSTIELVPFRSMVAAAVLVSTALLMTLIRPVPLSTIAPLLVQFFASLTRPVTVVAALVVSVPVPLSVALLIDTVPLNVMALAPVSVAVLKTAGPATVMAAPPPSVALFTVTAPSASAALFVSCPPLSVSGPVIDDAPASVRLPGALMVIASSLRN